MPNLLHPLETIFVSKLTFCIRVCLREWELRVFERKSCGLVRWSFGEFSESMGLLIWRENRVEVSIDVRIAASKKAGRQNRRRRTLRDLVGNGEDYVVGGGGASSIRIFEVFQVKKTKESGQVTLASNPAHVLSLISIIKQI